MLKLKNITKRLGSFSLSDISLDIRKGEYYVLLGRSGSGKTQLLELIAGLKTPDSGEIWIDGNDVTQKKIYERNTGLVFQDYAIFPNMTVSGNIAYSLHSRRLSKKEIIPRVEKIADELNIIHLLNRYTHNLSGGELQRVALARTLITEPALLLLDEPMASIDASLKDDIKRTLRQLKKKGLTIVHVTHDYREAVSLATRVGVIHNGHIIQEGPPSEVFSKPVNKFVARYSGIRNFYRVEFYQNGCRWKAKCSDKLIFSLSGNDLPEEGLMIIRSDSITIHREKPDGDFENCFNGVVKEINSSEYGMEVTIDAGETFYVDVTDHEFKNLNISELSEAWITFPAEAGVALQGSL